MFLNVGLSGRTHAFAHVREVLARANEKKSGDAILGVAAQTAESSPWW